MRKIVLLLLSAISAFSLDAFVSAQKLDTELSNPKLVLLDVGTVEDFKMGHIPKAQRVDISDIRKPVKKHQLMRSDKELQSLFRSLGIDNDSRVVIYGHNGKKESLKSAYTALALINMGLDDVSILDGGYAEWVNAFTLPVSTKIEKARQGNFVAKQRNDIVVDMAYVKSKLSKVPMLEARPPSFYYGALQSSGVERRGHIAGGMSSFWKDKFTKDDMIQSSEVLDEIFFKGYKLEADKEVILYCTGGLEASMNWYILHQHLKFSDAKMYDGSMREWGNRKDTPMVRYAWEIFSK